MKRILILMWAASVLAISGCATKEATFPLKTGEKIVFSSADRANAFRTWTGNDVVRTGRVVEVTVKAGLTK
jgi:hypothetical protein